MRRARGGALALALACAAAVPLARAHVPAAERVVEAVADANRASARTSALRLELDLRLGDGEPVARGQLVTHPTGLARLELQGPRGLVERHVLAGSEHRAARLGEPVESPRSFLPPLFLLQSDDRLALEAALASFGVDPEAVALAPCGASDCYVVGGRSGLATWWDTPTDPSRGALPSLWVDSATFQVAAILGRSGVRVKLGPPVDFDGVRMPGWLEIEEPGRAPARLDVRSVTPVNAPAGAFDEDWLLAAPEMP